MQILTEAAKSIAELIGALTDVIAVLRKFRFVL